MGDGRFFDYRPANDILTVREWGRLGVTFRYNGSCIWCCVGSCCSSRRVDCLASGIREDTEHGKRFEDSEGVANYSQARANTSQEGGQMS